MKDIAASVRNDVKRIWRGKRASDLDAIARPIRKARQRARAGHVRNRSAVALILQFASSRRAARYLHYECHAKAALDVAANDIDADDAKRLAHLAEIGFSCRVTVNGFGSMPTGTLMSAQTNFVRIEAEIADQICARSNFLPWLCRYEK